MPIYHHKPLGDLIENFDAKRRPVKAGDRLAGPYPYYGAQGIVDYVNDYLFDGEFVLVAEDGENLRSRKEPVALRARGKFWVNNHAHIIRGNSHADTEYLYYAINDADMYPSAGRRLPIFRALDENCRMIGLLRLNVHEFGCVHEFEGGAA